MINEAKAAQLKLKRQKKEQQHQRKTSMNLDLKPSTPSAVDEDATPTADHSLLKEAAVGEWMKRKTIHVFMFSLCSRAARDGHMGCR